MAAQKAGPQVGTHGASQDLADDAPKLKTTPREDATTNHATAPNNNKPRRNPVYGLEEQTMDNYSHIDHPDFGPRPRAPQFTPSPQQEDTKK